MVATVTRPDGRQYRGMASGPLFRVNSMLFPDGYPEPPTYRLRLTLEQHEIDQMNDDFLEPVDHELTDQRI